MVNKYNLDFLEYVPSSNGVNDRVSRYQLREDIFDSQNFDGNGGHLSTFSLENRVFPNRELD